MKTGIIHGKAHRYGDNIDTDVIIPGRYCTAYTEAELGPHCLEDLDRDFVKKARPGDLIVAGRNFGCGSSRENAPLAIKGAGVSCVIATSFARIFYRNAINVGLPILESSEAATRIEDGHEVEVELEEGLITNRTTGESFTAAPFPEVMLQIIRAGGMVEFVKQRMTG